MLTIVHASQGLIVTPRHREVAKDNKAIGILMMDPREFLSLTVDRDVDVWLEKEKNNTYSLEQYNEWARTGKNIVMPFLDVKRHEGKVIEHEGRHRAAACINAHVDLMPVAITLVDDKTLGKIYYEYVEPREDFKKRYLNANDLPPSFKGQFRPAKVAVHLRHFEEFYPG